MLLSIFLPKKSGAVDALLSTGKSGADPRLVREIYCHLVASQRIKRVTHLSMFVREAFVGAPSQGAEVYNRAAFVALALYVVKERAHPLVPDAARTVRLCGPATEAILLRGRLDLTKHWTLSAALEAVAWGKTATALGEWKELADSLPSGSGFSFVDLAANRSGLRVARLGVDERHARATAATLAVAAEEYMLPSKLLAAEEGLSEAAFLDRYGAIDSKNYQAAVARIDEELSKAQRGSVR